MSAPSALSAAQDYISRGFSPVPIPAGSKGPTLKAWQNLRLNAGQAPGYFTSSTNVGLILGEASGGLVDVDLDCPEARTLAARWLPPTRMRHGRAGSPGSHFWFRLADQLTRETFNDPDDGRMLLEVRGSGHQTVVPPSAHPSGEPIRWEESGEPAELPKGVLLKAVRKVAAGSLLANRWSKTSRHGAPVGHDAGLALAGFLLRRWPEEEVTDFLGTIAEAVGADIHKVASDIRDTARKLEAGQPVTGGNRLREFFSDRVLAKVAEWLGLEDASAAFEPGQHRLTDGGNAERLIETYGESLRYCHDTGKWLLWDGRRWNQNGDGEVERLASEVVLGVVEEIKAEKDDNRRQALLRHVQRSDNAARYRSMIEIARSNRAVATRSEKFDADGWLLNLRNGTLDLRTGQLRPHERGELLSKVVDVDFHPVATCPAWERFLGRVLADDADLIGFLRRAVGYSLTADTREQCFFVLYGTGRNGKSTFLRQVECILGDYAKGCHVGSLSASRNEDGRGASGDIARLRGARMVSAVEPNEQMRLDESKIKVLTGGDTVVARRLYQEEVEFKASFKLWLACNYKPEIRGTDTAIWRRVRIVPFTVTIPEAEIDPELDAKLGAEAPGILNWALRGLAEWRANGLGVPEAVSRAVNEYRSEMDLVGQFLADRCERGPRWETVKGDLYGAYRAWCESNGEKPATAATFGRRLAGHGVSVSKRHGVRYYLGLRLATEGEMSG